MLDAKGSLKLSTITDAYSGSLDALERVSLELGVLALSFKKFAPARLHPGKALLLETSSPSFKVSWAGLVHDYLSLGMNNLDIPLKVILNASNSGYLLDLIKVLEMLVREVGFGKSYVWSRLSRFFK